MVAPPLTLVTPLCVHDFRWSCPGTPDDTCHRPSRMFCVRCREVITVSCKRTSRVACIPCSERHRKRVARIAREGMTLPGRKGRCVFVTLTAPGQDVLPWDRSLCVHRRDVTCSGTLGCQVGELEAARWNASCPRRWDHFRHDLARVCGVRKIEAFGTWETQARGVLHRHAVLVPPLGMSGRRFLAAIRLTSRRQGFGRQLDVQPARDGVEWYLAKYASKSVDEIADLRYVDDDGEVIFGARYRPWSQSRDWFVSMRELMRSQRGWWLAGGGLAHGEAGGGDEPGDGAAGALDTYSSSSATTPDSAAVCPSDPFSVIH